MKSPIPRRPGSQLSPAFRRLPTLCLLIVAASTTPLMAQDREAFLFQQDRVQAGKVLAHLRQDELESALAEFGILADGSPSIHLAEDDGISAAAGGLHRALAQLSTDEQFDLLYQWSMPTESRKTVRMLTTLVPQVAPPKALARLLGERPRDDSFPIASIRGVRGLFCSGWSLVQAADDVGRLRPLTAELEQLATARVPGADNLLLLARLADSRADVSELASSLETRAAAIRDIVPKPEEQPQTVDPANIALAAAALQHASLRPTCEDILGSLVEYTYGAAAPRLRPFLRLAHATAIQLNRGTSGAEVLRKNRLKYWVPSTGGTSQSSASGAVDAAWLVHEDHILHLAGAGNDVLFFRYPLTGNFEFRCEAQEGGRIGTDGGLVYGGLHFQALGSSNLLNVWDADLAQAVQKPCPFVRHADRPTFNRMSIRSTAEQAVFTSNLHPMWFDPSSEAQSSPWLGLWSFDERRPMFRNLAITGSPIIPREVRLSAGPSLRGWQASYYRESVGESFRDPQRDKASQPSVSDRLSETAAAIADWQLADGEIQAVKHNGPSDKNPQSLLRYQRPLLDGETITYEFYYQPNMSEVHPAIGQVAFLIEPGGVRIHWMTNSDREWTGLPADNALLEPLNRRGPRTLPLKENSWNQVMLTRAGGKITLSLNDTEIYQRDIDYGGDHKFGFYRDRTKSTPRIRNVVLRGDWPESLPKDCLENPAIANEADPN